MRDRALEVIVKRRGQRPVAFDTLMPRRVRNILLVSSLYDSFTFEEDGHLNEMLFSEYLELNLRFAPHVERVSTAEEALQKLRSQSFDLVISMLRVGKGNAGDFGLEVRKINPDMPVVLLAYNTLELNRLLAMGKPPGIDLVFVWLGDARLFLAIIKCVEDLMNAEADARSVGVRSILLVEDNVRFYSSYLPMLYTELVQQTQSNMADGLNRMDKLLRQRARHKILLATSYEEGLALYWAYKPYLAGVIVDARFPRDGEHDPEAGVAFTRMVLRETPFCPVLLQSSDADNAEVAAEAGAAFIHKRSPSLLGELREFMREHLGFGEFKFRMPDGTVLLSAWDLRSLREGIASVPEESIIHHASRNDFSTWLMARTEFELANHLRQRKVDEFSNAEEVRAHLCEDLDAYRSRMRARVVAEFSSGTFEPESGFVRIGHGSLGGKGRGLAFVHALLEEFEVDEGLPDVEIYVPPTAVLATGAFDEFMASAEFSNVVLQDLSDEDISERFLDAELPPEVMASLRTFLERVHYPLAVRSSSLLEDASHQPFAGVYLTRMIPNNHPDLDVRLRQLADAVRLVYASTYHADAKSYIASTPNRLEEEKMAVVIQEVVGRPHEHYLYPDIAGVARSYDFYPLDGMKADEGVASAVLGLGRLVVDGGRCVRFSPEQPRRVHQLASPESALQSAQREFLALDLSDPALRVRDDTRSDAAVARLKLDVAKRHGTLRAVGSVYCPENDAVYDGTSRPGVPLVSMAGVLKASVFPLAETLSYILKLGRTSFACPVEIEFAANLKDTRSGPHRFAVLQMRPIVVGTDSQSLDFDRVSQQDAICVSNKALGLGFMEDVRDVVYVPRRTFDRGRSVEVAAEIGRLTEALRRQKREFLLIGPGRWGSSDRWLGIPVTWKQIAGARCIVETDMEDIRVEPSQGTHFFHNLTSFGIGYFTVNFESAPGHLDHDWLDAQEPIERTDRVRVLRFEHPLEIMVNGHLGRGVIMKPGCSIHRYARSDSSS